MGASASERAAEFEVGALATAASAAAASPAELSRKPKAGHAGESSHQLPALHGLRFLAAFCILFSHSCSWLANFKDNHIINRFGEFFTVFGMPLFFVLSGFVIHYNYSRLFSTMPPRWAVIEFLGARFARIYPLFICFFLVGLATDQVLQWYYDDKLNLVLILAHSLTLTQSWVYITLFGDRLLVDGPYGLSWSLSTEFFFYLLYIALVIHIARLRTLRSLLMTAGAMSLIVFAALLYGISHRAGIEAFAGQYMDDHFDNWDHSVFRWFFYYSPYVRSFEFVLGCLTAQIYFCLAQSKVSSGEVRLSRYMIAGSLIFLIAFALTYLFEPFGPFVGKYVQIIKLNYGPAIPIAVLVFCVSRYRLSAVATLLSTPLMILLGDLSYSIYTVHTWTLRIFARPEMTFRIGIGLEAVFRIALAIALTVILSFATYRLIEVPARAWLRAALARRLVRSFGPRDANMLSTGLQHSPAIAIVSGISFILMVGAVLAYQSLIVPYFWPYTR
jgi:peptidoglycan/LPS O-acetylase OafA/YrhL